MGWANCGNDSMGRPIGYAHSAKCDHEGCDADIDRGLDHACGGMHGKTEFGCEKYFCADHMEYSVEDDNNSERVCEACMVELTTSGEWALHPEDWSVQRIPR